jgi:hypothetical protein
VVAANRSGREGGAVQAPGTGALDLHEAIATPRAGVAVARGENTPPDPLLGGCRRCPEHLRLLNELTGEVVPPRCRATNQCAYCARIFAVETTELLMLDALEHAPTLYVVLTARELLSRADCRDHLTKLRRKLRRRWPEIEWAVLVEFQRRGALHLNLLVKGVPVEALLDLRQQITELWCARVDAQPQAQFVGEITAAGGLVRYIALHFLKPAQAPPEGWRGHRFSTTRGYLVRPTSVMRQEARASLRSKRAVHAAIEAGHQGHDAELVAHQAVEAAAAATWRLVQILPTTAGAGEAPHLRFRRHLAVAFTACSDPSSSATPAANAAASRAAWSVSSPARRPGRPPPSPSCAAAPSAVPAIATSGPSAPVRTPRSGPTPPASTTPSPAGSSLSAAEPASVVTWP